MTGLIKELFGTVNRKNFLWAIPGCIVFTPIIIMVILFEDYSEIEDRDSYIRDVEYQRAKHRPLSQDDDENMKKDTFTREEVVELFKLREETIHEYETEEDWIKENL